MPSIKPGDTFFDMLPDGRYEKCVLQPTTPETPDRHAAARGGTGEFYRVVPVEKRDAETLENAEEVIWNLEKGCFDILERIPPS